MACVSFSQIDLWYWPLQVSWPSTNLGKILPFFCTPKSCLDWQTASIETTYSLRQLRAKYTVNVDCILQYFQLRLEVWANVIVIERTLLSFTRLKPTNSNWVDLWPVSGSPRWIQGHWGRCLPSWALSWSSASWLELKAQCCRAFKHSQQDRRAAILQVLLLPSGQKDDSRQKYRLSYWNKIVQLLPALQRNLNLELHGLSTHCQPEPDKAKVQLFVVQAGRSGGLLSIQFLYEELLPSDHVLRRLRWSPIHFHVDLVWICFTNSFSSKFLMLGRSV